MGFWTGSARGITLASQQYTMLKQSDTEYDEKFQKRITAYKEEMSKEMNTQMITMVGIFTALAFLIFGSISSLDGVFENIHISIDYRRNHLFPSENKVF